MPNYKKGGDIENNNTFKIFIQFSIFLGFSLILFVFLWFMTAINSNNIFTLKQIKKSNNSE
jgi:hypothetical protein